MFFAVPGCTFSEVSNVCAPLESRSRLILGRQDRAKLGTYCTRAHELPYLSFEFVLFSSSKGWRLVCMDGHVQNAIGGEGIGRGFRYLHEPWFLSFPSGFSLRRWAGRSMRRGMHAISFFCETFSTHLTRRIKCCQDHETSLTLLVAAVQAPRRSSNRAAPVCVRR